VSPVPPIAGLASVDAATLWKKKSKNIRPRVQNIVPLLRSSEFYVQPSDKRDFSLFASTCS
jgi:hypothetical protein